ncbi:ABC transporter ATP-binding protein [Roseisalinus antarcticus]|uniref:Aliphatic sulfonates import ATP-binding protein SsuB n=1 Tax=Roseisalinus antarcticus TaxID=254357 RepID=A0A1Y5RDE4_9RHOB|nr:ABC transporter ATP-binding protein [Roseisalinus antarcticus]SLN14807.1 Aliphatic sulfonates import ATP-binding protein SsuB [Roseisalinus antarcticus]
MTAQPSEKLMVFEKVGVTYGTGDDGTEALQPTDLTLSKGDFLALVGPSGCGKSTILKLVSEVLAPTTGNIFFSGRELGATPIRVGMAFQSASLLPWMTVRDNVMLPLKIVPPFKADYRAKRRGEYRERVDALLEKVGLIDFADNNTWELSGGMMQRANLCRALIHEPDLLLLDEPFGALDQFTREELWQTLQELWIETRPTVILVTHDLREAAYLASRICVMSPRPGRIVDDSVIDFVRPRDIDLVFEPDFVALVQRLRNKIVHTPNIRKRNAA